MAPVSGRQPQGGQGQDRKRKEGRPATRGRTSSELSGGALSSSENEEDTDKEEEEEDKAGAFSNEELNTFDNIAATMSPTDRKSIKKNCDALLAKISLQNNNEVLSTEEMVSIIEDWKPKQDILCLYIRIARKLPLHFHQDSISTLLCLSKQCGYTPVEFLTKTKCLRIVPSIGRFPSSFSFKTVSNKTTNGESLDRKFVGLSVTLTLLEHAVGASSGVISRNGMRSKKPRQAVEKELDLGGTSKVSFKTMPTTEFHKKSSLMNRLWTAINHRWVSFQLVQQLFDWQGNILDNQSILVYSFMMHASCGRTRYDFLAPMVGICLRYNTRTDIESHRPRLDVLWKNPATFLSFGNSCLQRYSDKQQIEIMVETLVAIKNQFSRPTSYSRAIDMERKWLMLRAYVFFFWLKRHSHSSIRCELEKRLSTYQKKSQILTVPPATTAVEAANNTPSPSVHFGSGGEELGNPEGRDKNKQQESDQLWNIVVTRRTETAEQEQLVVGAPQEDDQQEEPVNNLLLLAATLPPATTRLLPFDPVMTRNSMLGKDWSSLQLTTQAELDRVSVSYLLIHTDSALDICEKLSTLEVYSADRLHDFRHCRVCGPPGYQPGQHLGDVVLNIGSDTEEYLDRYSRLFHVARHKSVYFKEHTKILPSTKQFGNLCKSILKYGKVDSSRANCQYRVNIGCGGQDFRQHGVPAKLVGTRFGQNLDDDEEFVRQEVLGSIGATARFLWKVSQDMQVDVGDAPLAGDSQRWIAYAKHLCEFLFIDDNVGFEDITLVISPRLTTGQETFSVSEHKDVMNDTLCGYSRTCAFNASFTLETGVWFHMQLIGNFRRVVRQHLVPFEKALQSTITNARRYIETWRANMQAVFAGVSKNTNWDPFDRSEFFLDDKLPFKQLQISAGTYSIHGEYLLTEIGLSRVTSFSMFIDSIVKHTDSLSTDQQIEIVFFASFFSNPFWFHHVMDTIDPSCFGLHPMYKIVRELYSTFGNWQGGPYNRWSPCGGRVPVVNLFGAHPTATITDLVNGTHKLVSVIKVLLGHLQWVNSLQGKGLDPMNDLPLSTILIQWESISKQIHNIVPCQFSLFRLSVFTTIAVGCNLMIPGPHLKQVAIPLKGTAAFKHLLDPSNGSIPEQYALDLVDNNIEQAVFHRKEDEVKIGDHDRFMLYLSNSMGRQQYVRDEIECLLCESHPARNLECQDWFCKGQNIFDLRDDGIASIRAYGENSTWKPIGQPRPWSFKFLQEEILVDNLHTMVYYEVNESLGQLAHALGEELRQSRNEIIFNGRHGSSESYDNPFERSMKTNPLILHQYQSANMYSQAFVKASITNHDTVMDQLKMQVLGNGEQAKHLMTESNAFESFASGSLLMDKLEQHSTTTGHMKLSCLKAGCLHQESLQDEYVFDKVTYFPGHLDKPYMDCVQFLPLSTREFYTYVGVPGDWNLRQDRDSLEAYQKWIGNLTVTEKESIEALRSNFALDACKFMKSSYVTPLVFWNKLGSILQFPSHLCYHATVIPAAVEGITHKQYRDLLILHPLHTV